MDDNEGKVGPVIIWIGVFPESGLSATDPRNSSLVLLALLKDSKLTNIEIEFGDSDYIWEVGPWLLAPVNDLVPLVNVRSKGTNDVMSLVPFVNLLPSGSASLLWLDPKLRVRWHSASPKVATAIGSCA